MKIYTLLLIILLVSSLSAEIFTTSDSLLVNRSLEISELVPNDLKFLKDWSDETSLKNDIILNSINNPYYFINYVEQLNSANDSHTLRIESIKFLTDNKLDSLAFVNDTCSEILIDDELELDDVAEIVEKFMRQKAFMYKSLFNGITKDEKETLVLFSNSLFNSQENEDLKIDTTDLETIVKKIDWIKFYQPAMFTIDKFPKRMLEIKCLHKFLELNSPNIIWQQGMEIFETPIGNIIIGGVRNDLFEIDQAIAVIDPAGNDSYHFLDNNQANFFLLDISGNDYYYSEETLFSANNGFSLAYDLRGDDIYTANNEAFSSKLGFQEFIDFQGDDTYKTKMFSLGASLLGSSICMDMEGNDSYTNGLYGEGFASVWGFGVLYDAEGADNYFSGNLEYHAPLSPNDFRSMGQGMGFGLRPDIGGGIGILIDKNGNDRYNGGVYAQGVGYWYALGILIDNHGNDFYNAVYYPQGSGIHLAGGFLYDGDGEDSYYSKHGPGQGAGHDFGVGIMIDGSGNDHYSIEGGNGLGITNSVGLFIDKLGNDRYENGMNSNYGYGKKARRTGSIGLFIDASGKDFYPSSTMKDSTHWVQGLYGTGLDTLFYVQETKIKDELEMLSADIDSLDTIENIFKLASQWEVGNVVEQVRRARKILLTRHQESADYIINHKLNSRDTKEYRAIKEFFKDSEESRPLLVDGLISKDSLSNKNSISLAGTFKIEEFIPYIVEFLNNDKYIRTNISALGSYKNDEYITNITNFMDSPNEKVRFSVASALIDIDSDASREVLETMKSNSSFLTKTMIKEYIRNYNLKKEVN